MAGTLEQVLRYLLQADASGMTRELTRAQKSLKDTGTAADKVADKQQKAARETSQAWERTGTRMATVGKSIAAGFASLAVGALVRDSINEARKAAQVQRETAQVLKTTGGAANVTADQVKNLSARLGNLAAVDGEVVQAGANVLLTFTKVRNEAGKGNDIFNRGLAVAQDLAAKMRTDLQPAVLQVGKALNDPIKGLTSLGRAGIQFTKEQKEQIKTLVETGRTLEAQNIILGELEQQVGGTAAAMADPFARFQVAVGDAKEAVGEALMPVMEDVAKAATDLAGKFGELDVDTRKWILGIGAAVAAAPLVFKIGKAFVDTGKAVGGAASKTLDWVNGMHNTAAASEKLALSVGKVSVSLKLVQGAALGLAAVGLGVLFQRWADDADDAAKATAKIAGNPKTLDEYRRSVADLTDAVASYKKGVGVDLGFVNLFASDKASKDYETFASNEQKLNDTVAALGELSAKLRDAGKEFGLTAAQTEALTQKFGIDLSGSTREVTADLKEALGVTGDLTGPQKDLAVAAGDAAVAMADQATAADKLKQAFDEQLTPTLNLQSSYQQFTESLRQLEEDRKKLTDGIPDTAEELAAIAGHATTAARNFGDVATNMANMGQEGDIVGAKTQIIDHLIALRDNAKGAERDGIQVLIDALTTFDGTTATADVDVNDQASAKIANIGRSLDALFAKVGKPEDSDFIQRVLGIGGKKLFATGGVIGGIYAAGTGGGKTSGITAVVGEGNGPEYVIPTEPRYRTRAISLMTAASTDLGLTGLARGGILEPFVQSYADAGGRRAVAAAEALYELLRKYGGGKGRQAAEFARAQVGKPYVWGASGPNAYDCSGLTMAAWRSAGVGIPRVSHAQIAAARAMGYGEAVGTAGSLFFTTSAGSPSGGHIAISHGDGTLTNARGRATGVTITGPFGGRQGFPNFDSGGVLMPGLNTVYNGTGRPEHLSPSGVVVYVNVAGSVVTEHDLVEVVHRGLLDKKRRVSALGLT